MPIIQANGIELYYLTVGAGIPCLVMHGGLGLDHTYLHPYLDPLGDIFTLTYYDHRGNGRSGRPPLATLTFEAFAADADAIRASLGHDQIAIIGHSFGSFLALEYALRFPERVSHLILVGTAPAWDYQDEMLTHLQRKGATQEQLTLLDLTQRRTDQELAAGFRRVAPLYFHEYSTAVTERLFGRVIFDGSALWRFAQLLDHYDVTTQLSAVHTPTLILSGQDDWIMPPSQAQRVQKAMPSADLVLFARSGHFPYIEEPARFFSAIRHWFARCH